MLTLAAVLPEGWRRLWSNNASERLNPEIRRDRDVVGSYPDGDSGISRVGGVLAEQHDEWTERRRYLDLDGSPAAASGPFPTRVHGRQPAGDRPGAHRLTSHEHHAPAVAHPARGLDRGPVRRAYGCPQ